MFTVSASTREPIEEVWRRVSDLGAHADGVPFTSSSTDPGAPGKGWRFVARTAVGPVGFDDSMVITEWDPPRRLRVEKTGRVLAGWADITLAPLPEGGTHVTWQEEVVPAHARTARVLRPAFDAGGKVVFGAALRRMLGLRGSPGPRLAQDG
ncbi:MAG: SRPBCC family protein [Tetrasphaera sp.]|nr:SRPBCC family protein [Tetrasphaera sp.]